MGCRPLVHGLTHSRRRKLNVRRAGNESAVALIPGRAPRGCPAAASQHVLRCDVARRAEPEQLPRAGQGENGARCRSSTRTRTAYEATSSVETASSWIRTSQVRSSDSQTEEWNWGAASGERHTRRWPPRSGSTEHFKYSFSRKRARQG